MSHIGTDLRTLRKHRGLTLQAIADRMGRSVGWVSQVERGLSQLPTEDIPHMARILDIPATMLSTDRPNHVLRAGRHRTLPPRIDGLAEALLSPDLTDDFEVVHSTFQPGAHRSQPVTRATQELAYLIEGKLDIWIGEAAYTLTPGDSARLRGEPFRWANPYDTPAIAVWVISPPVY